MKGHFTGKVRCKGDMMRIRELFDEKEIVYSFEIFPPKPTFPIETVYSTIDELSDLGADYISVTYGAGGSINSNRTAEIASIIKNKYGIEALAHLTCVGSSEEKIDFILKDLKEKIGRASCRERV